jgi:hypothetical protein
MTSFLEVHDGHNPERNGRALPRWRLLTGGTNHAGAGAALEPEIAPSLSMPRVELQLLERELSALRPKPLI